MCQMCEKKLSMFLFLRIVVLIHIAINIKLKCTVVCNNIERKIYAKEI